MSFEGYRKLFRPTVYNTLENTIIMAGGGTFIALFLGVTMAIFTVKTNIPGKGFLTLAIIAGYLPPAFIQAVAWTFYVSENGGINELLMLLPFVETALIDLRTVWGMAFIGGLHFSGLVFLIVHGSLSSIPSSMEEAAIMNGSSRLGTLTKITIPLILPVLMISAFIVLVTLMSIFDFPLYLGLPEQIFVLSTHIFFAINKVQPDWQFASALGMILVVISLLGLILQRRFIGDRTKYEKIMGAGESLQTWKFEFRKYRLPVTIIVYSIVFLLYLFPLVPLVLMSFQSGWAGLRVWDANWTLENYSVFFTGYRSSTFWEALPNTLIISGVGGFLGMAIASGASYIITKSDSSVGILLDYLSMLTTALPVLIAAIAWLWVVLAFDPLSISGTIWIIMIAFVGKWLYISVQAMNSSFQSVGDSLEEAAQISGAGFTSIFGRVYAPLVKVGFLAGYMVLFIDFMKILAIPIILGGSGNPVLISLLWEMLDAGLFQAGSAVAVILLVMVLGLYYIVFKIADIEALRL